VGCILPSHLGLTVELVLLSPGKLATIEVAASFPLVLEISSTD